MDLAPPTPGGTSEVAEEDRGGWARPPWHDVPIYEGRDLASDELWQLSLAIARTKRRAAEDPPRLPKARRASVSLVVAAVAAAAPALSVAHSGSGEKQSAAVRWKRGPLELGDRGPAVVRLQRALGITADGIFGPRTLKAVRALQKREGLAVDGIVGAQTRAALERSGREGEDTHSHGQAGAPAADDIDERLLGAFALAREMGLTLLSAHRPGATIGGSGNVSDHAYLLSKAIDLRGSADEMTRYALAVAGLPGVETVIHSGVGMWIAGSGWGDIRSEGTFRDHVGHVHVDTF